MSFDSSSIDRSSLPRVDDSIKAFQKKEFTKIPHNRHTTVVYKGAYGKVKTINFTGMDDEKALKKFYKAMINETFLAIKDQQSKTINLKRGLTTEDRQTLHHVLNLSPKRRRNKRSIEVFDISKQRVKVGSPHEEIQHPAERETHPSPSEKDLAAHHHEEVSQLNDLSEETPSLTEEEGEDYQILEISIEEIDLLKEITEQAIKTLQLEKKKAQQADQDKETTSSQTTTTNVIKPPQSTTQLARNNKITELGKSYIKDVIGSLAHQAQALKFLRDSRQVEDSRRQLEKDERKRKLEKYKEEVKEDKNKFDKKIEAKNVDLKKLENTHLKRSLERASKTEIAIERALKRKKTA